MANDIGGNDLVLPNDSFAHVLDETKGHITCYVGPSKTQLAGTDKLVIYDPELKKYRNTSDRSEAVQSIKVAPEGWYIVLKNPTVDRNQPVSSSNTSIDVSRLEIGRKIHIPGPVSFALWPGQMAKVVQGHHLRTNQYLIVRVYDADAAKKNWSETIIQKTSTEKTLESTDVDVDKTQVSKTDVSVVSSVKDSILAEDIEFTVGKLMIVKGTDVSFFIPPTGIEVVKDRDGSYTREAVTLERLFYCILLDESGSKRYIRGPAVVFPLPTEIFQTHLNDGKTTRKFRAIELNDISGIYVKVVAPYTEKDVVYKEGQELFITGKDQAIYYRRDEHQIIRYGEQEIHYATAIPKGEARYLLNRLTGDINTRRGPAMLLPDPRSEVITRRYIPAELCKLMYPNNAEALLYNQKVKDLSSSSTDIYVDHDYSTAGNSVDSFGGVFSSRSVGASSASLMASNEATYGLSNQEINQDWRKPKKYTKPRTVTLDSKYEGAVQIKIWTGYAVLVVNGDGQRKIIEGPATYNLEYDEYPEVINLSTGKPKNTDKLLRDIYLRTKNNKISDIVEIETKDLVSVSVKLSYRMNFVEDNSNWFDVENYVKFLCDHMRSRLKGYAQTVSLSAFYSDSVNNIRNVVLKNTDPDRRGFMFRENNMLITDVEVLSVTILDRELSAALSNNQTDIVTTTINVSKKTEMVELKKRLNSLLKEEIKLEKEVESVKNKHRLETIKLENEWDIARSEASKQRISLDLESKLMEIVGGENLKDQTLRAEKQRQSTITEISEASNERKQQAAEIEFTRIESLAILERDTVQSNADAVVKQMNAVTPGLVEALQANAQVSVLKDIMPSAIPLSIVESQSVSDTLGKLFKGTSVGRVLNNMQSVS